jgi:hypothetical protein
MARKNIEDQLGTVDHPPLDDLLDISLLRSGEIVIEEEKVRVHRGGGAGNFFQLARANQSGGIGPVAPLQNLANNFRARAAGQCPQLGERFIRIKFRDARLIGGGLSGARS